MENRYRSRKWLITAGTVAFAAYALWEGRLDSKDFAVIAVAGVAAYNIANGWGKT